MLWYCDASALAKRYIREVGSQWFRGEAGNHFIIVAQISIVEVRAAVALRLRMGSLSAFAAYKARQRFAGHLNASSYQLLLLTNSILEAASQLVFRHPLRAYDAVQLASALDYVGATGLEPRYLQFLTADDQLERAGQTEGFSTENPNRHP